MKQLKIIVLDNVAEEIYRLRELKQEVMMKKCSKGRNRTAD